METSIADVMGRSPTSTSSRRVQELISSVRQCDPKAKGLNFVFNSLRIFVFWLSRHDRTAVASWHRRKCGCHGSQVSPFSRARKILTNVVKRVDGQVLKSMGSHSVAACTQLVRWAEKEEKEIVKKQFSLLIRFNFLSRSG